MSVLRSRLVVVLALMALAAVVVAVASPSGSLVATLWPVGLASVLLTVDHRASQPVRWTAIGVVALVSFAVGGLPVAVSVVLSAGVVTEAGLTRLLLVRRLGPRLDLAEDRDVASYLLGTAAGAAAGGLVLGLAAALTGADDWAYVALAAFLLHWLSHLLLLGVVARAVPSSCAQGTTGRCVRWAVLLGLLVGSAIAGDQAAPPLLAFPVLVFPVLAWGALRAPLRETALQLVVVGAALVVPTAAGRGLFSLLPGPPGPAELVPVALAVLAATLTCLPLSVTVGRARTGAREAATTAARLENITATAPGVALMELDATGRIALVNPAAANLLGPESEVVGRRLDELGSPQPVVTHRVRNHRRASGRDLAATPQDWRPHRAPGDEVLLALSLVAVESEDGEVVGHVASAQDVTARLHAEQALGAAREAERRVVAQLEEATATKDAFVSTVSHELRTPLTSIIGWLEILTDDDSVTRPANERSALWKIQSNSQRLLHLIDSLLLLSRLETTGAGDDDADAATDGPEAATVDLTEVVRSATAAFLPGGSKAQHWHQVVVHLPSEPLPVRGHADQLGRLVTELCDNAVTYTPGAGVVTVTLRADPAAGLVISVADTGVGLSPSEAARVFGRFVRGSYAEEHAIEGAGMGLSLSRDIARKHGGGLTVTSAPGKGCTFTACLPPVVPPPEATPAEEETG
ncbi:hypothetical protein SAMN04488570_1106 [Nocardioides scoriae]|uniref:histidine kinase n=1 Tax=Nocardioides scoriae TaxID=642780 RepID=A0A1H1PD80_9ACTN|nr:PAS domain-containing sensor histidine kinase [Nocardioides scoriae]SDS09083.1 hypothetical protein SAMN04488570_1106 [Nocardioides scoriae]